MSYIIWGKSFHLSEVHFLHLQTEVSELDAFQNLFQNPTVLEKILKHILLPFLSPS